MRRIRNGKLTVYPHKWGAWRSRRPGNASRCWIAVYYHGDCARNIFSDNVVVKSVKGTGARVTPHREAPGVVMIGQRILCNVEVGLSEECITIHVRACTSNSTIVNVRGQGVAMHLDVCTYIARQEEVPAHGETGVCEAIRRD